MRLSVEQLKELISGAHLDFRGKNLKGICPKCGVNEFGISLSNNHQFGCYRLKQCGWRGNIFTLLRYLGKLHEYIGEDEVYSRKEEKLVNRLLVKESEVDLSLDTINPPIGWKRVTQNDYLDSRGFTQYDYNKYVVGTTTLDPKLRNYYVIFLEYEKGELKGWVARHIWDKKKIQEKNDLYKRCYINKKILRYQNSDTEFSKLLGGSDELTENTTTLILVEGKFDQININRLLNLDSQEEVKCCCTWKCDISPEQIFKIQRFTKIQHIILLYDPDVINQVKKVALSLEDRFHTVEVGFSENGKDPGEMMMQDLEHVLSNLQTPEEFAVNKLQIREL